MTDKELIRALRKTAMVITADGIRFDDCKIAAADRLEALLAENEHLREVMKMNAVEVVRCRDCKFFQTFGHSEKPFCQKFFGLLIKPDDFCSYGRKGEKNG